MSLIEDKAVGRLAGAAVGDALGGATEGWTPEQIVERYGGPVDRHRPAVLPDWSDARPIAPYHKGDGHITDDTLMTHALVEVYAHSRQHLDAYLVAEHLVPLLINEKRWVPELETSALLLQRIFLAEKWLVARLHYGHVDPREAGVGNIVNCGAAMYMAPVGVANAADPAGAYAEAIDIAGAHQSCVRSRGGRRVRRCGGGGDGTRRRPGRGLRRRRRRGSRRHSGGLARRP